MEADELSFGCLIWLALAIEADARLFNIWIRGLCVDFVLVMW